MDEIRSLSITSKIERVGALDMAGAGDPHPEKMAATQSKNRDEKNAATGCPGPRF